MVELRKRKTPPPAPVRPAKKASALKGKKAAANDKTVVEKASAIVTEAAAVVAETVTEAVKAAEGAVTDATNGESKPAASATSSSGPPKVGDTIDLASFGGEVETHDGEKTTLANLVKQSKGGVVLFTYPKASTPGCTCPFPNRKSIAKTCQGTKQVCLFRDSYAPLTATGFSIFGLSNDSPKANTTFKTKQSLPYSLLCDPSQTLISAIGLKKAPKGTTRGVFVVNKEGKVLASEPGSPDGTHKVVQALVAGGGDVKADDTEAAETAAEVADTAAKVDETKA